MLVSLTSNWSWARSWETRKKDRVDFDVLSMRKWESGRSADQDTFWHISVNGYAKFYFAPFRGFGYTEDDGLGSPIGSFMTLTTLAWATVLPCTELSQTFIHCVTGVSLTFHCHQLVTSYNASGTLHCSLEWAQSLYVSCVNCCQRLL